MFALTLPQRLPNFCSAIRATLGQRQIRQSPGLALNAHSGNEWGKIPVLTGEGLPTCRVKCLDRVLRTTARLVGRIPRFGRVSGYMRDVLHWLPYPQRIVYRISALVRRCMEGLAPSYLQELC